MGLLRPSALIMLTIAVVLVPLAEAGHTPGPSTHFFSRINAHHAAPTDMDVIIIPPGYVSSQAMLANTGWVGAEALYRQPGTQAVLEATQYWAWIIDQFEAQYPQLAYLTYEVRVLGYDAEQDDLNDAEIVITTAMAGKPAGGVIFHFGLGLPTQPATGNPGSVRMSLCTVWLTGLGSFNTDRDPLRVRNLAIHEFGHCLAAGHTGGEVGSGQVCNSHGTCFNAPNVGTVTEDVMSVVHGQTRQCLSNINVQGLAEGYDFLPGAWDSHDTETYMPIGDYAQTCMPSSMNRF